MKKNKINKKLKIAIGVFDGVHLGHQKIIENAHKVITIYPHPSHQTELLTTLRERRVLINNLAVLKFNKRLSRMMPEAFVKKVLVKKFKPIEVIVGFDFHFGHNRSGNAKKLERLGKKHGFKVTILPPIKLKGKIIKSSIIRTLLAKSKIKQANEFLGRYYFLEGKIVKGHGRGADLGFPTANIIVPYRKVIPGNGVYSVVAVVHNKKYKGVVNIGFQPTFKKSSHKMEVHLIDYNEPKKLYRKKIVIYFKKFFRQERRFKNQAELKQQIKKDVALAKKEKI